MKDISHYRRTPIEPQALRSIIKPQPAPPPRPVEEPEGYVAFRARDHVMRIQFRPAKASTCSMHYMQLPPVFFDGEYGTNFVIIFPAVTVRVRGHNLQPVITAIEMGTAEYVQEFDPERWAKPADANAPIIEWMEIEANNSSASALEAQPPKAGAKPH